MLTDREIAILVHLRGLSFVETALNISREDALKAATSADCSDFFLQARKEVFKIYADIGVSQTSKVFKLEKEHIEMLKAQDTHEEILEVQPRKRKRKQKPVEKDQKEFVTPENFIKQLSKKRKKSSGVIVDTLSALSKEFLIQEAERLSTRFGICDKYDVDRVSLKDWTKSYHLTGVLRGSQRKYKKASPTMERAYQELMAESL